ncbi:carbon monoxide dehydrogenase G protein [Hyphomicrobiales bacterium]|nr:carbon monoxide dehydrogenase G protein [Hyphomicrobiales bacterium]CAH1685444.1 carbon monoxide dehydrogenase G protein [Hyphomicrobiales bacterium]
MPGARLGMTPAGQVVHEIQKRAPLHVSITLRSLPCDAHIIQDGRDSMALLIEGEERITAPVQVVWDALNDPAILQQCIPGCQSLTLTDAGAMEATVVLKVGPIKATFAGSVALTNLDPPNGYTIQGEGKGGVAGFAKGGADVVLIPDGPEHTLLRYTAKADVGGKIAQLGSRLMMSTAKKLSGEFFSALGRTISADADR